ncbi:MAG: hypothetical protein Q7S96_03490 [bacterium]|nr:hypothetical protein [bacterium]
MAKRTRRIPEELQRFQEMTNAEIRERLLLDERADDAACDEHIEAVLEQARRAKRPLTERDCIFYAQRSLKRKGNIHAWNQYLLALPKPESRARAAQRKRYHAYLVRIGSLKDAARIGPVTDAQSRAYGYAILARRSIFWNRFPVREQEPLNIALACFTRIGDRRGIAAVLKKAIRCGDEHAAGAAARALGSSLTRAQLTAIAGVMLSFSKRNIAASAVPSAETEYPVAIAQFVAKHRLRTLYATCIQHMAAGHADLRTLKRWATRFMVAISEQQLMDLLAFNKRYAGHPEPALRVVRELARRNPRIWKPRMRKYYAWARDVTLAARIAIEADRYGKRCGRPLTVAELTEVAGICADRIRNAGVPPWAVQQRKYCLDRATKRIAQAVRAPARTTSRPPRKT